MQPLPFPDLRVDELSNSERNSFSYDGTLGSEMKFIPTHPARITFLPRQVAPLCFSPSQAKTLPEHQGARHFPARGPL
jgi:hypothetical protein